VKRPAQTIPTADRGTLISLQYSRIGSAALEISPVLRDLQSTLAIAVGNGQITFTCRNAADLIRVTTLRPMRQSARQTSGPCLGPVCHALR